MASVFDDMNLAYRCRENFVLYRLFDKGRVGEILTPQQSVQGKERVVIGFGPDVKDLQIGDKILVIGTLGVDTIQLPTEKDVYMTRAVNVALILTERVPESER